jgi:hypothetical protein
MLMLLGPTSTLAEDGVPAAARDEATTEAGSSPHVLGVGAKAGVGLPQLNTDLGTTFQVRLEAVYLLGAWGSRLGLVTALGYSQPEASGAGSDPQLLDGAHGWSMTQRQTTWDIGLMLRVMEWDSPWNLSLLAGAQLLFLSTLTDGESGGEPFGQHDERATLPGVFGGLQAEYRLGPGALFAEVSVAVTFQDLRTTGDVPAAALGILAGYRFTFAL